MGRTVCFYLDSCAWEVDFFRNDILDGMVDDILMVSPDTFHGLERPDGRVMMVLNHTVALETVDRVLSRIRPEVVFHCSDEIGMPEWVSVLSRHAGVVFRQYMHRGLPRFPNVYQMPLGYMRGFEKRVGHEPRTLIWSFVGNLKSDRADMIRAFQKYPVPHLVDTSGIVDPTDMAKIYRQSVFVPNGRGGITLDCFRLYEACIAGAIPVIVGNKDEINTVFAFQGDTPPFLFYTSWEDAAASCLAILAISPHRIEEIQKNILAWWHRQIAFIRLRADIPVRHR